MHNLSLEFNDDEWYPAEFSQLMVLKDNMDSHAYEIEADLRAQLKGQLVHITKTRTSRLVDITGFEMDLEEYIPACSDENALNAIISFRVDGECETNGIRSDVRNLPVSFDFQYVTHNTGYTISDVTIGC